MAKEPMFWEDLEQARQRLKGCIVLYDDYPFYVRDVGANRDGVPIATGYRCSDKKEEYDSFPLSDEKFHRFRKLPNLGWMNMDGGRHALHLSRVPRRNSIHGYSDNNVVGYCCTGERGIGYKISQVMTMASFEDMHRGKYPSMKECIEAVREDSSLAFNRQWAVACDKEGLKFLYRGPEKIGLFTDVTTLNIFKKNIFYREEIMETPIISVNIIREL